MSASTSQLNPNGAAANKTKDLFNSALQARNPNNAYIAHLKIWEEVASEAGAAQGIAASGPTKRLDTSF